MSEAVTVKELKEDCEKLISMGLGDRTILISKDDEANEYHTLWYSFTTDKYDIEECYKAGLFHDDNNPKEVVLLG